MEQGQGPQPLVVLCGPTAAGKTALALQLAERYPFEVISADSRQVYRGMDIGTAKATPEERARVPHHLIDVIDPDQTFSAADFCRQARDCIDRIFASGRLPLVVGGTGLYIRALTEGLIDAPAGDPALRRQFHALEAEGGAGTLHRRLQQVDPAMAERLPEGDLVRIVRALEVFTLAGRPLSALQREHAFGERPFRVLRFGVSLERDELYLRIDQRAQQMVEQGLLEEVRGLLDRGYEPTLKALQTIGYREAVEHLQGRIALAEALELIRRDTRRYAKRQLTWFRKENSIIWVDSRREFARIQALIDYFYAP
ncbi:tRNA (adenosine(37)-N6)-dimethylallyltransferase MiaA [Desulfuromonas versatilis]